jgi:hypothetical protein
MKQSPRKIVSQAKCKKEHKHTLYSGRCEFDLLFYNSQSQANWSRKNGQALPAVRGEISNTEI